MAYQYSGVDSLLQCVPKDYLLDIYPSLSNLVNSPTLYAWGDGYAGALGNNTDNLNKSSPAQVYGGGSNWKQLSCGYQAVTAIKTDGTLWGWGYNATSALGDNTSTNRSSLVQIYGGGNNWVQTSSGAFVSAAIKTDGTLWCWGYGGTGALGNNTNVYSVASPVQTISTGTNWKQVSTGYQTVTAIKTDGTLWCWGRNDSGELGDGTTVHKSSPVQTIAGGTNWKQVVCANNHTAAIKTDGTLWCWGTNNQGQLGDNSTVYKSSPVQTIAGGTNWKQVSVNGYNTAAIKTDGTLWAWGINTSGGLGDGTLISKSSPVQTTTGGNNWKFVACGYNYGAAIKTDGTLWTWGRNDMGQLGNNTSTYSSSPSQTIIGSNNWRAISNNMYFLVGILDDPSNLSTASTSLAVSSIVISGLTSPINNNTTYNVTILVTYTNGATSTNASLFTWSTSAGLATVTNVTSSGATLTTSSTVGAEVMSVYDPTSGYTGVLNFIVSSPKTLWGWGSNSFGQLGDNTTNGRSSPVQTMIGDTNWMVPSMYGTLSSHSASISSSGVLWVWGYNNYGQLGDGTTANKSSPVQTSAGGSNWKQVATGLYHTAAIKTDGSLWTCGYNQWGNLGDNTTAHRSSMIQTVAGGNTWKFVASGGQHSLSIKTDGTLWGWGRNADGQVGSGTAPNISSPVQNLTGGTNWASVTCGYIFSSAIKTDGTLWTWGSNAYGQLGNLSVTLTSSPVQTTAGGTNWKQVSNGYYHSAAIKTDGTLWMWGRNNFGQLGDTTTVDKSSPVQTISSGTNWMSVSCGYYHSAAIKTDGTLWSWGYNGDGQLGDNTTVNKSSPIQTTVGGTNWINVACGRYHTIALKT